MKRKTSILIWGLLGAAAFVFIGGACILGLLVWMFMGPDPEAVLAKAQPDCEPVVAALGLYHERHGRYPQQLSDLVKEGLLTEVPKIPPHRGTWQKYGPIYEINTSLKFYRLFFGYHLKRGFGPGNVGDTYFRVFLSDDPAGWKTVRRDPGGMETLVAERLLITYRERHDKQSLDLFMSDVVGKVDCNYLYRDRVTDWLGEAEEIDVPPDVPGAGKKGYVYQARDDASSRYCFVYKDHWLPFTKSLLPPGERARYQEDGYDSVDINYPVLDKLYLIREADGRPSWAVVHACPASPMDKPSRPTLVSPR